jgi:hypothetical protein
MITSNPCSSLAVSSKDSFPLHQPASPQRSETTYPMISGCRSVRVGEVVLGKVRVNVDVQVADGVAVGSGVEVLVGVGGGAPSVQ